VLCLQPFVVVACVVIVCGDAHNIGGYDEAYLSSLSFTRSPVCSHTAWSEARLARIRGEGGAAPSCQHHRGECREHHHASFFVARATSSVTPVPSWREPRASSRQLSEAFQPRKRLCARQYVYDRLGYMPSHTWLFFVNGWFTPASQNGWFTPATPCHKLILWHKRLVRPSTPCVRWNLITDLKQSVAARNNQVAGHTSKTTMRLGHTSNPVVSGHTRSSQWLGHTSTL
jgi:hypothetical protein